MDWRDLPGLRADDVTAVLSCLQRAGGRPLPLRPALAALPALAKILREAETLEGELSPADARRFLEARFAPVRLTGAEAFFTGYYEPELEGSLERTEAFMAPLLARPADLVTLSACDPRPSSASGLSAMRRGSDGELTPYPDRAEIEAGIEEGAYRPVVWLRDRIESFMVQVQGSARIRLADGSHLRVTYAGRNGLPYTSIGRVLVEQGAIGASAMSLDRLKGWVRDNGLAPGQPGYGLLMRNRSYIFFEAQPDDRPDVGPIGGAGLPLTPLRSIAVDRTRWCYGLPFWVDVALPDSQEPFRRLCVAEDTGSAIVGEARVDLFMGSGEAAGRRAGSIRHHGALTVLWPREVP